MNERLLSQDTPRLPFQNPVSILSIMTTDLHLLNTCELHVHTGGCLFAEDLLELGKDIYEHVDWHLFVDSYKKAFGLPPDPVTLFRGALSGSAEGLERFRRHYVFSAADGGDFSRFQAKFNLAICLHRYWRLILGRDEEIALRILDRHRSEGLRYVEYRAMSPHDAENPEDFIDFHILNARLIKAACGNGFEARYIISLPRWAPLESYALVKNIFTRHPELIHTIVGLDFCFFEEGYPPEATRPFFARLAEDNRKNPDRALEVVYHVGETYFDKSLESAVRWCHQAAELGVRRLGHAIALGLDPTIAVSRRPDAHLSEPVGERLAQIAYDLEHCEELASFNIELHPQSLQKEREELQRRPSSSLVERPYTPERLEEIRRRQDFVLERLARLDTVIETCPTSNLRIGGVPRPADHPLHRFLDSRVDLAIGADDPGIFDSPLAAEVDWAARHTRLAPAELCERLGDPRRFRLGTLRS